MQRELKPCPFCGGKAFLWTWNGGARVDCENWRGAYPEHYIGVGGKTADEAVEAWNKRVSNTN